jgi:hypothetical protein
LEVTKVLYSHQARSQRGSRGRQQVVMGRQQVIVEVRKGAYGAWPGLRRVVEFMAHGRVYGGWSSLWRVVEFMARSRVQGRWSSLGRAGHFGGNNVEQQLLLLNLAEF